MMPRIAVDAMGGDRGPGEVVAGALEAAGDGLTPILFGSPGLDRARVSSCARPTA